MIADIAERPREAERLVRLALADGPAPSLPLARTMDEQINRLRSWAEGRARNASAPRHAGQGEHLARKVEF